MGNARAELSVSELTCAEYRRYPRTALAQGGPDPHSEKR